MAFPFPGLFIETNSLIIWAICRFEICNKAKQIKQDASLYEKMHPVFNSHFELEKPLLCCKGIFVNRIADPILDEGFWFVCKLAFTNSCVLDWHELGKKSQVDAVVVQIHHQFIKFGLNF